MNSNNYHDKEVVGFLFNKGKNKLELICEDGDKIIFQNIVQFEIDYFSGQNVLFDIEKYKIEDIPKNIIEDFIFLKNLSEFYKEKAKNILVYNLISSTGLCGVVVTDNGTIG